MDDIVTLLRKYQPFNKLHGQAADEIERLRKDNTELKDARIDLRAVENIVGSVQDLLLAVRRQHDIQLIQKELIASKDAEIERLRQLGDKLAMHLDAFFGMLEPASNEITEVIKEWRNLQHDN